jgi:hypothetical protein
VPPASRVGNAPASRVRFRGLATLGAALLTAGMSLLAACSSEVEQQEQPPQQQAIIKAPDQALYRDRLQVQTGNLALPYDQLGELEYTEPFSPRAIDDDYIDDKLRAMAMRKWGDQVDAIIDVNTTLSSDESEVSVTAQAVKVRGDCSFCRHQGGYPAGQ